MSVFGVTLVRIPYAGKYRPEKVYQNGYSNFAIMILKKFEMNITKWQISLENLLLKGIMDWLENIFPDSSLNVSKWYTTILKPNKCLIVKGYGLMKFFKR